MLYVSTPNPSGARWIGKSVAPHNCTVYNYSFRLPSKLVIEWPEDDKLDPNSKIPAGTTIGVYFSINDKLCCIRQFSWLLYSFNLKIKADRKNKRSAAIEN